jgi:hypothetical protein
MQGKRAKSGFPLCVCHGDSSSSISFVFRQILPGQNQCCTLGFTPGSITPVEGKIRAAYVTVVGMNTPRQILHQAPPYPS